jgi:predicted dehydrogenase
MEAQRPLRLALVGCGAITQEFHLPALAVVPDFQVTYLCDRNTRAAELARLTHGLDAQVVAQTSEVAGKVDAALVAVPPRFHAPVVKELLASGCDVLCEKPLTVTMTEGRELAEMAARGGRLLGVGLMQRFAPANEIFRRVLQDGMLGEVQEVVAESGATLDWTMTSGVYYDRAATGGGVFFDAGVHLLDRVGWVLGPLRDISYMDDSMGGVESNAELRGRISVNGREVPAVLRFSWTHQLRNGIAVKGTRGTMWMRMSDAAGVSVFRNFNGKVLEMRVSDPANSQEQNYFVAQWQDFASAMRQRRAPFVTAESSLAALGLIEEAYSLRQPMPQPWVTV